MQQQQAAGGPPGAQPPGGGPARPPGAPPGGPQGPQTNVVGPTPGAGPGTQPIRHKDRDDGLWKRDDPDRESPTEKERTYGQRQKWRFEVCQQTENPGRSVGQDAQIQRREAAEAGSIRAAVPAAAAATPRSSMARTPRATVSKTSGQGVSRFSYQSGYKLGNKGTGSPGKSPSVDYAKSESSSSRSSSRKAKIDEVGGMNISYGDTIDPTDLKDIESFAKTKGEKASKFLKVGKGVKFKAGKGKSAFLKGKK